MRLSLVRWALLASALALFASGDDASAQAFRTASADAPAYGYGSVAGVPSRGPVVDLRRSAPPDQAALSDADDDDDAADDAGEGDVDDQLADAEQGAPSRLVQPQATAPAPRAGERQTLIAVRDESLTGLVAAHPSLPLPSLADVSNNGRAALVRVERRSGDPGRIAVSPRAAEALGIAAGAQARVEVRYLGPAPGQAYAQADTLTDGPASLLPPGAAPPDPTTPVPARPVQSPPPPVRHVRAAPPPPRYFAGPTRFAGAGYMVQVGAFAELPNARRARAALISEGEVSVEPRTVRGAALYRVRLGPWNDRAQAEAARSRVAGLGFPDAIITPR